MFIIFHNFGTRYLVNHSF